MSLWNILTARLRKAPTRAQWFAKQENVERLREIMADDVFIAACNHTLDLGRLDRTSIFNSAENHVPLRAAYAAGYADFLSDLSLLASAPVAHIELPPEWSHIAD